MVSHPEWVRGLKPRLGYCEGNDPTSHPEWVRGLKHNLFIFYS